MMTRTDRPAVGTSASLKHGLAVDEVAGSPLLHSLRSVFLLTLMVLMTIATLHPGAARAESAGPRVTHAVLDNGLEVVVIPDRRAPVVTHMVFYKVGAADEKPGKSGIAHFLEHLMFKGTEKIAPGEFSKIIARNGGQDNAFTAQDVTAYFQRVSKDRLPMMMEMEADRMVNLRLTEQDVTTERDVILEERRSRVDNEPSSILNEQMDAALYLSHPYGIPVIGWEHEMASLDRADALAHYKRFYAPNNAILVVAGDVEAGEVLALAKQTYGMVPANPAVGEPRQRPSDPPHRAARRLELRDARAGQATVERDYLVPSYRTAEAGEAEALEVLMRVVAASGTSRLYKALVVDGRVAASAGGWYSGSGMDSGKISIYAIAAPGHELTDVEAQIDKVIADVVKNGITPEEVERAKRGIIAADVYSNDSQSALARRYGWALATGGTIERLESWPSRIKAVTTEAVNQAAAKHLRIEASVTGWLVPIAPEAAAKSGEPAKPSSTKSPS